MITKNEILSNIGISEVEFNFLYNIAHNTDNKAMGDKFILEGILQINDKGNFEFVDDNIKELFQQVMVIDIPTNNLEEIAAEIKKIYPMFPKTSSSKFEIATRLKKLQDKCGITLKKDEVIDATRRYIESFNGDYTYLRYCKYFIFKNENKGDGIEFTSELLNWLENKEMTNTKTNDWLEELV